jgi:O-antigen/teichoic acid export membrane protein
MGFSGLNALSANVTVRIDAIMIPLLLSLSSNGTYLILMFISNTIGIPNTSLNQIASPVVSESLENGDMQNIDNIYKKTSLNSFIIGAILFIILWAILPDIVSFMAKNNEIQPYLFVFFYLGIAKLIDMLTSVNTYIIIYSKYYRYNLLFLSTLAFLNIVLNYILILDYGIVGAAMATAISMALYNIFKLIFIQIKFNLFPFTKSTLSIVLISILVFFISTKLPNSEYALANLVYNSRISFSFNCFLDWDNFCFNS